MLETGIKAPEFTLPDQNGEMHNLTDYRGKKVILYFTQKIIHLDVQSKRVDTVSVLNSLRKRKL